MSETNSEGIREPRRNFAPLLVGFVLLLILMLGVGLVMTGTSQGTRLVYRYGGTTKPREMASAVRQRMKGIGSVATSVSTVDEGAIEILIDSREPRDVDYAKMLLDSAGVLRFLPIADSVADAHLVTLARESSLVGLAPSRELVDSEGGVVARWVTVADTQDVTARTGPMLSTVVDGTLRRGDTGALVDLPVELRGDETGQGTLRWMSEQKIQTLEVLTVIDESLQVFGSDLVYAASTFDQNANPAIAFELSEEGSARFFALTSLYTPTGPRYRQLGIILDDVLLSAPNILSPIRREGRITGNFTAAEVQWIVSLLQAGRLPEPLTEAPSEEMLIEFPSRFSRLMRSK